MQKKKWLWIIWQCTWGVIQTFFGASLFLLMRRGEKWVWYKSCIVLFWGVSKGLSAGLFIFVPGHLANGFSEDDPPTVVDHEYGHSVQSAILGPLYMIIVGLPSMLWCNLRIVKNWRHRRRIDYYSLPVEKWADRLGGVDREHE